MYVADADTPCLACCLPAASACQEDDTSHPEHHHHDHKCDETCTDGHHHHEHECDATCSHEGHHHSHLDHKHDTAVTSVGIVADGCVDMKKLNAWLSQLLQDRGPDLFRSKGILAVAGTDDK
jgi:G3E family GTPase